MVQSARVSVHCMEEERSTKVNRRGTEENVEGEVVIVDILDSPALEERRERG